MIKGIPSIFLIVFACSFCLINCSCSSTDKEIKAYSDKFYAYLDTEIDTVNEFLSAYDIADFNTENSITAFQRILPSYLRTFNDQSQFYKSPLPQNAPAELKEAVNSAIAGTDKIISGINTIDSALTSRSNSLLPKGQSLLNEGTNLINQASKKYNSFADSYNAKAKTSSGGTNILLGILIGTAVLWILGLLIVHPVAKYFTKLNFVHEYAGGGVPDNDNAISSRIQNLYNRNYIITDVIVLSIAGFLMGILAGWYFIGLSWKWQAWPGLIAFIGLSVFGSFLHG